jgi:hypothetical protein
MSEHILIFQFTRFAVAAAAVVIAASAIVSGVAAPL